MVGDYLVKRATQQKYQKMSAEEKLGQLKKEVSNIDQILNFENEAQKQKERDKVELDKLQEKFYKCNPKER